MRKKTKKGAKGKPSKDHELPIEKYIPLGERWKTDDLDDMIITPPAKKEEPTMESNAKGGELFYVDEAGNKSDASIHEGILAEGNDDPAAFQKLIESLGLSDAFKTNERA